jgi:hypothetical protein
MKTLTRDTRFTDWAGNAGPLGVHSMRAVLAS